MRLVFIFLVCVFCACSSQPLVGSKFNGVSLVASQDSLSKKHLNPVLEVGANAVTIMPFGYMPSVQDTLLFYDSSRQWFGETMAGISQYTTQLHAAGLQVMLKPQIWVKGGVFTGEIAMRTETDWKLFEAQYHHFMINFARVAEANQVALLCIGTELKKFVAARPQFWKALIKEIRSVYSGKLTYAANWDSYQAVHFWEDLDYIGIDAYFPLDTVETPAINTLKEAWQKWLPQMESLANQTQKPILFTEYGYRSVHHNTTEPWQSTWNKGALNLTAQVNAYEALFQSVWDKEWFGGGFVWKWFLKHDNAGGLDDNRFTPQNKPAEAVMRKYYLLYK